MKPLFYQDGYLHTKREDNSLTMPCCALRFFGSASTVSEDNKCCLVWWNTGLLRVQTENLIGQLCLYTTLQQRPSDQRLSLGHLKSIRGHKNFFWIGWYFTQNIKIFVCVCYAQLRILKCYQQVSSKSTICNSSLWNIYISGLQTDMQLFLYPAHGNDFSQEYQP